MTGDDVGPDATPGDLTGDVAFTLGSGCGAFDYGFGDPGQRQADRGRAGEADDGERQPARPVRRQRLVRRPRHAADLTYAWDFDGNGTWDATGSSVAHKYAAAGTFAAKLRVTDTAGLVDVATIAITVR